MAEGETRPTTEIFFDSRRIKRRIVRMTETPPKYKMEEQELRDRLDRIKRYNEYQRKAGQPHHCTRRQDLEKALAAWGHDPAIAAKVLRETPPSPFLESLKTQEPGGDW